MKHFVLFTIVSIFLIIGIIPVYAQYTGDKYPSDTSLEECIGGPEMCPEQQLEQRLENDQKNALFVVIIGIPSLAVIGFIVWRKKK